MLHVETVAVDHPLQGLVWLPEGKLRVLDLRTLDGQPAVATCSAPAEVLYEKFGLTAQHAVEAARRLLDGQRA